MLNRRTLITVSLFAAFPLAAQKAEFFDIADFKEAQKAGKRILVEVTAPWCPTCRVQKPIITKLLALPENKDIILFIVDFDTQKEELRFLKARSQSTIIGFNGAKEGARLAGDTKEESIARIINSTRS